MAGASRRHDRAAGKDARRASDSASVSAEPSQGAGDIEETWWPLTFTNAGGEGWFDRADIHIAGMFYRITHRGFEAGIDYGIRGDSLGQPWTGKRYSVQEGEGDTTPCVAAVNDLLELRCALIELARKHRKK